jgi:hypothetical protein
MFRIEMGFSLVVQELINAKKPLIGHNCMYDIIFVYNQFISKLPATYPQFIESWNKLFPFTFDNKVLAYKSGLFDNTTLGKLFTECTTGPSYSS